MLFAMRASTEEANSAATSKPVHASPMPQQMSRSPILWLMLAAIVLIGVLAWLDADRESAAALADFAQEQATLAESLAADLSAHLAAARHDAIAVAQGQSAGQPPLPTIGERYLGIALRPRESAPAPPPAPSQRAVRLSFPVQGNGTVDLTVSLASLLTDLKATERPNQLLLLLRPPETPQFHSTDGRLIDAADLGMALDRGRTYLRLPPAAAGKLGLPARTAVAGLARIDTGAAGQWGIVAVASAERERDRERWARWRLILSVAMASGLVLSFGGLAMRNQRRELVLQHQLALADLGRERDERLERAGRAATMGALAVGVAHEISTPLGIIAGRAEQLAGRVGGDERASSSVRIIVEQIDRIHRVIRGLLGLARGDRPTAEPVEASAMVREAVGLVEHRFAQVGVRLTTAVPDDLPTLHGDPRLLEHAVVNLLRNACDACLPGAGHVRVTAAAQDQGRQLVISVVDDGRGISPHDAERVLEPFFSTKANGRGTGLGLPLVQEIVVSHRGTLTLEPVLPHGTRAVIQLPATEEPAHA
jgi:two-component system, NtrC family, sensor kinase